MKVPAPKFNSTAVPGTVTCAECPFANEHGRVDSDAMAGLCDGWYVDHEPCCPTRENYAEACNLAEQEVQ